jgi:hypothetical protein
MKIDTDLRLAIKSAEKAQPQDDWRVREAATKAAIADLFERKPTIAVAAKKLVARAKKAEAVEAAAREELCKKYGLRTDGNYFTFSNCGDGQKQFEKVGGKVQQRHVRWTFDAVMLELAKATPQEGAAIIKRLGINWT